MTVSFGETLQDQATTLSNVIGTNLAFIGDVRTFYAERVALEREYAKGLQALALKAQNKAFNITPQLVAGDAPSKQVSEGAGRDHTLDTAWHTILAQTDEEAYSRTNYAESMQADVVDALKLLGKRMDALRQKQTDFANGLVKERDQAYTLKAKAKDRYDASCKDVESNRQKAESMKSDRKAEKANAQAYEYMTEMYNAKNAYLLAIEVSNRMKDKYFEKDLPSVHDDYQALWSTIVTRLGGILKKEAEVTKRQYEVLSRYNDNCVDSITAIDPERDQELYVEYNRRPFFPAPVFTFEPCSIWHDNDQMSLETEPKVFLQNKLIRNKNLLMEINPRVDSIRREVLKLVELRSAYMKNPALGDLDSVTENYFECVREATSLETERDTLEAEIELLQDTLGTDTGSGRSHDLKASSFPVSKQCYVCQQKIWGMGKVGLTCRDCGTHLHTACELKCPADCGNPILEETRAASKATYSVPVVRERTTSYSSTSNGSLSKRGSMFHSRSSSSVHTVDSSKKTAKAVYNYESQSSQQLSISKGETLEIITDDSGNGWTKVSNSSGEQGIVPSSYIKASGPAPALARRPTTASVASSTGSTGSRHGTVTAIYAYQAASARELTIEKGETLELTAKGHQYAPGWTEVQRNGQKGIVPTTYIR